MGDFKKSSEPIIGATDRLVHVDQAAEILGISQVSVRRYLTQKKLRRFKVGSRTVLKLSDVLSLIREA